MLEKKMATVCQTKKTVKAIDKYIQHLPSYLLTASSTWSFLALDNIHLFTWQHELCD